MTCFRATEPGLDRIVELRVLPIKEALGPAATDRFSREVRALAGFDHPSLIQVLDVGKTQECHFYTTYYRKALPVSEILRNSRFPERRVLLVAKAIGSGLGYLHRKGLLHCSVAAQDLFFDEALERFYFGDYGTMEPIENVAGRLASGEAGRLPLVPEIMQQGEADIRSDLFLLAATLHEMVTGLDPLTQMGAAGGDSHITPPREVLPALGLETEAFLVKALQFKPADRFQTGAELAAAADSALRALELKESMERRDAGARMPDQAAGGGPVPPGGTVPSGVSGSRSRAASTSRKGSRLGLEAARPSQKPLISDSAAALEKLTSTIGPVLSEASSGQKKLALAGTLFLFLLLAFLMGSRNRAVLDPQPAAKVRPPVATKGVRALATRPLADAREAAADILTRMRTQVRSDPTDTISFRDRWQVLRRWYVTRPVAERSRYFEWDELIRVKLEFASDPRKASRRLDSLYQEIGPSL